MIKAGIAGGAGYTAGELIRLLLHHPRVEIRSILSSTHEHKDIAEIHADLYGDTELRFTSRLPADIDILFLCLPHGS